METIPIEPKTWKRFAAEFTRTHDGWPLVIESAAARQPELETMPFHGMTIDDEKHTATLILGEAPDEYVTYSIGGVRSVSLESNRGRSESSIRMETEDGRVMLLHFELVDSDGIQPTR